MISHCNEATILFTKAAGATGWLFRCWIVIRRIRSLLA
jgi:hypothetical protein